LNTFIQTHNATNIRTSFVVFIGNGVTEEAYEDVKTGFFIEIFVGFSFAKPCGYRFPKVRYIDTTERVVAVVGFIKNFSSDTLQSPTEIKKRVPNSLGYKLGELFSSSQRHVTRSVIVP